jgi:BlaI family transcriptional regulator, penicillinase repressor
MKKLTDKELVIMNVLWAGGALSMRDIMEKMPEPKPHFSTISTFVHRLEAHGMIKHQEVATRFYSYEASMGKEEYMERLNNENIDRFFNGSYMSFLSRLVKEQKVSVDELKQLIKMVENDDDN